MKYIVLMLLIVVLSPCLVSILASVDAYQTNTVVVASSNDTFFSFTTVTNAEPQAYTNYMYSITNGMSWAWSSSVSIHGVEFKLVDDILVVDTHGKSMNEAASNLFELVVSEFTRSGYKLIKE